MGYQYHKGELAWHSRYVKKMCFGAMGKKTDPFKGLIQRLIPCIASGATPSQSHSCQLRRKIELWAEWLGLGLKLKVGTGTLISQLITKCRTLTLQNKKSRHQPAHAARIIISCQPKCVAIKIIRIVARKQTPNQSWGASRLVWSLATGRKVKISSLISEYLSIVSHPFCLYIVIRGNLMPLAAAKCQRAFVFIAELLTWEIADFATTWP